MNYSQAEVAAWPSLASAAALVLSCRSFALRVTKVYVRRSISKVMYAMQVLTVPYLIDNPEVGYVQARWTFANPDESYLTKVRAAVPCSARLPLPAC